MLHQVGVSFDLYYDARKHKIKICTYVFGCKLSLVRLCDSDCGITPVDDITVGISFAAFCFHIAHISFASFWYYEICGYYYYYYYYYYYVVWRTASLNTLHLICVKLS